MGGSAGPGWAGGWELRGTAGPGAGGSIGRPFGDFGGFEAFSGPSSNLGFLRELLEPAVVDCPRERRGARGLVSFFSFFSLASGLPFFLSSGPSPSSFFRRRRLVVWARGRVSLASGFCSSGLSRFTSEPGTVDGPSSCLVGKVS